MGGGGGWWWGEGGAGGVGGGVGGEIGRERESGLDASDVGMGVCAMPLRIVAPIELPRAGHVCARG